MSSHLKTCGDRARRIIAAAQRSLECSSLERFVAYALRDILADVKNEVETILGREHPVHPTVLNFALKVLRVKRSSPDDLNALRIKYSSWHSVLCSA